MKRSIIHMLMSVCGLIICAQAVAQTTQPSENRTSTPPRAAISLTLAAAASIAPAPATVQQYSFRDRYGMLADHNIFLKDRAGHRDRERGGSGATTQPGSSRRTPEQSYVLTGVVLEGGERRAYFEDLEHGGLVKVSVGDKLAKGKVAAIDIDEVSYAQDDRPQVWIKVGSDLTGAASTIARTAPSSGSSDSAAPTSGPAIDPNSPNLSVQQRMMLRRQQELQRVRR